MNDRDEQEGTASPAEPDELKAGAGPGPAQPANRPQPNREPAPQDPVDPETGEGEDEDVARIVDRDRASEQQQERDAVDRAQGNMTGQNVFGTVHAGRLVFMQNGPDREGDVQAQTGQVPDQVLRWLRRIYVEPDIYDKATERLRDRRVLLLRGPSGWGKQATARRLLMDVAPGGVFGLEPDLDVQRLGSRTLAEGGGYVVDGLPPDRAEALTATQLHRLTAECRRRETHLVFTIGAGTSVPQELADAYLVDCTDPVDDQTMLDWLVKLLSRHLEARLRDAKIGEEESRRLLDKSLADQSLRNHLRTRPPRRELDRLARLLQAVALDELPLDQALSRFDARAREEAAAWFAKHPDTPANAFYLALMVYNGCRYQTVLDAATDLEPRLDATSGVREPDPRPVFDAPRTERLEALGARIRPDTRERTMLGSAPVELVEVGNPALPAAALDLVWHEHDRARRPLLQWLRALGGREDLDLRTGAAAAVGKLCTFDFRYLHDELLVRWARSPRSEERLAAAWALGVPAVTPGFSPLALQLLRRWGRSSDTALQWTAAAAWGTHVGVSYPDVALRNLRRIAGAKEAALTWVVVDSLADLYQTTPDHGRLVLDELASWTAKEPRGNRHRVGLLAFLQIAFMLWGPAPPNAEAADGERWPLLLVDTHDDSRRQRRLLQLWRRALNDAGTAKWTMAALGPWVWAADTADGLYQRVEWTVLELAEEGLADERAARRLELEEYLRDWADDRRSPSTAAARILAALQEGNR
jgi:hypothetical protein